MSLDVTLLEKIDARFASLPPALKKVGRHVLDEPSRVLGQTTRQIASASQTGSATVVRFYRQMGCDSLSELKILLAGGIAARQSSGRAGLQPVGRVGEHLVRALEQSLAHLDGVDWADFVGTLSRAARIYVIGEGLAQRSARMLSSRLVDLDLPAFAVSGRGFEIAHRVDGTSVVVYFAEANADRDNFRTFRRLRKAGVYVAIITAHPDTKAANASDIVVPAVSALALPCFTYHFITEALMTELSAISSRPQIALRGARTVEPPAERL